jgi:hypothetical protein
MLAGARFQPWKPSHPEPLNVNTIIAERHHTKAKCFAAIAYAVMAAGNPARIEGS